MAYPSCIILYLLVGKYSKIIFIYFDLTFTITTNINILLYRNDRDALTDSRFREIMEDIQRQWFGERVNGGRRFSFLGDGIFTNIMDVGTCIRTYHQAAPNAPLEEWEFLENCGMKSVREFVEHGYAALENVMGITADPKQWYLMASKPYVVDMYIACVFFYNCYVCCFGNQCSNRLECIPPSLEEYLNN